MASSKVSQGSAWQDSGEPNPGSASKRRSEAAGVRRPNMGDGVFKSETEGVGKTLDLASLKSPTVGEWLPPLLPPAYSKIARRLDAEYGFPEHLSEAAITEAVVGEDTRRRIKPEFAGIFPYNAICQLIITAKNGAKLIGTGWFGGSNILYTAGHCTFDHERGGLVSAIEIYPPGENDDVIIASNWGCTSEWAKTASMEGDMGCVIFKDPIPKNRGWLGFNHPYETEQQLLDLKLNIFGYPGEKNSIGSAPAMYGDAGQLVRVYERQLKYVVDTTGGESGAPLMTSGGYVVGIHNYGEGNVYNLASRITPDVRSLFRKWKEKSQSAT